MTCTDHDSFFTQPHNIMTFLEETCVKVEELHLAYVFIIIVLMILGPRKPAWSLAARSVSLDLLYLQKTASALR